MAYESPSATKAYNQTTTLNSEPMFQLHGNLETNGNKLSIVTIPSNPPSRPSWCSRPFPTLHLTSSTRSIDMNAKNDPAETDLSTKKRLDDKGV